MLFPEVCGTERQQIFPSVLIPKKGARLKTILPNSGNIPNFQTGTKKKKNLHSDEKFERLRSSFKNLKLKNCDRI